MYIICNLNMPLLYAEIMSIVLLTYYKGKMSTYVEKKIGVHIDQYSNFNEFLKSPVDK